MNVVKFYQRDTGALYRVRVKQRNPVTPQFRKIRSIGEIKNYSLPVTERAMANAGYFRKRPKV